jgi:DNA invertase Pin-like site-specific DNA recombinase
LSLSKINSVDLKGRPYISYLRFSSAPQEGGSTIERQQETLNLIVKHYGLVLDRALEDRAMSASKGLHRKKGALGALLALIKDREIPRGTVLTVESIDRLTRERFFDVFDMLKTIIEGGLIIVTGDLTIWDDHAINSPLNHKLIAEINAARSYAERLGELAAGAHAKRRQRVAEFAADPSKPRPTVNGIVPAWIVRTKGQNDYRLHPVHSKAVKRIFVLCGEGASVRQIADIFNREKVPLFPRAAHWRAPRIGAILRDRHVLGFYTPTRLDEKTKKRNPIGPETRIFPPAIDAADWVRSHDVLAGRRTLIGRRGTNVPNLFTGKARCKTCGGTMRVDTGGGIRRGKRQRSMLCASYIEAGGCKDNTRYDLDVYEAPILMALLRLTSVAPKAAPPDQSKILGEIAAIRVEIEQKNIAVSSLIPMIGASPTLAETVAKLSIEVDTLKKKLSDLKLRSEASTSETTRAQDVWDFLKRLVRPAVHGDVDTRDKLRTLLTKMDYYIVGDPDLGGLIVGSPSGFEHIGDSKLDADRHDYTSPSPATAA